MNIIENKIYIQVLCLSLHQPQDMSTKMATMGFKPKLTRSKACSWGYSNLLMQCAALTTYAIHLHLHKLQ